MTLSFRKSKARDQLRNLAPFRFPRHVFFLPGWTNPANLSWTGSREKEPVLGWEYSIENWVDKYSASLNERIKIHFLKLVADERNLKVDTVTRKADLDGDPTASFTNFFQFAELFKRKVRDLALEGPIDLIGHSMGGLVAIAAAVLDPELDMEAEVQEFIETKPLQKIHALVTVAAPFKGSPMSEIVKRTYIDEIFCAKWSDATRRQCEAMAPDSPFIHIVNLVSTINRLRTAVPDVHVFGNRSDPCAPLARCEIEGTNNHPSLDLAGHGGQRLAIVDNPILALEIFRIILKP